ncbi:MAG TPA: hypothetical protein VGD91_15125 [Trebonia sp.]
MTAWSRTRTMSWSARALMALGVLAVLLIAAVPASLFAGVILVLLGHVVGGLALFGASILAAGAAVVAVTMGGLRQLRKLVRQQISQQANQYASPMVQLGRDDYRYQ